MKNKTLGLISISIGVLIIFSKNENAWILSALLIGFGTGMFFWKE